MERNKYELQREVLARKYETILKDFEDTNDDRRIAWNCYQQIIAACEAMRESRLRMRGNKMSLFLVYLSYLGWQILGIAVAFVLSEALASWFVSPLAQPALQWLLTLLAASFLRSYISAGECAFFRALEQSEDGGE